MKIRQKTRDTAVEVYAVYWVNNPSVSGHGHRMYLVIPYAGYTGLLAVHDDDCDIIDPSIDGFILMKDDYGGDMLVHWAIAKDHLINDLIEHDPRAIDELRRRLNNESV